MPFHTAKRRIQPRGRRAALDVEAEAVVVDPDPPGEQNHLRLPGPAPARPHRLAWMLVGAMLPVGLGGGYLALRQALAPSNGVLIRREGMAGIYRVEVNGQTFLVNSLGGLQKLDPAPTSAVVATPVPASSPSATPVRPVEEALAAADAPESASLPRPPGTSAAAGVLAQYRQYVQEATRRAPTGADAVEGADREGAEPVVASVTPAPPSGDKGVAGGVGAPVEGGATAGASPAANAAPAIPRATPAASVAPQNVGVMRRQAAWAGLLAGETVVHPELSRSAVVAPSPATGPRDAVPVTGPHVDNVMDAMPASGDAAPGDAAGPTPAASVSPAASASPASQAGAHPRARPRAVRSRATPAAAAVAPSPRVLSPQRTLWEVLFKKRTWPVPADAAPKRNAPLTDEEEEP